MSFEKVSFPNQNNDLIGARLDLPDGDVRACALFAHCFTCNKNLNAVRQISRALNAEGIAVLRFDFTGLGESEGDFADTNFSSNVDDLVKAAEFMGERFEAPALLIGHSLGGAAALMAAHQMPSVKAVATIGAPCDPEHVTHLLNCSLEDIERDGFAEVILAGRPFTIKKQFLDDLAEVKMNHFIRDLDRALIVFHAPLDDTVGIENAAHIFTTAKHPKSFVSLDTADHLLNKPEDARYVGDVIAAWAHRYLG